MADLGKLEEGEPNIKMMTILENIRNNAQCTNENGQNGMKLRAKNKTLDETERSGVVRKKLNGLKSRTEVVLELKYSKSKSILFQLIHLFMEILKKFSSHICFV